MAPIPEHLYTEIVVRDWMPVALGVVLTACVSLSIALIVLLCGGKQEEKPKEEAPPAPGDEAPPAGDAPAEQPKEGSKKEEPAPKSAKPGPSMTSGSAKGPELKLTSEKPGASPVGKSAKGPALDPKKMPSLQLQAATAKK